MLRTFWTILGSGKQGVIEDVGVVKQQALPLCPRSGRSRMQRRPGAMALKAVSIPLTSKNKHYSASLTSKNKHYSRQKHWSLLKAKQGKTIRDEREWSRAGGWGALPLRETGGKGVKDTNKGRRALAHRSTHNGI